MEFGVHLPQIAFDDPEWRLEQLQEYVAVAERAGFRYLCANDHLVFSRPWLDGPTALAALLPGTDLTLATTIANPVVREPAVLAKALDTLDLLSGGRLVVGVGPGSSSGDYEAVGLDFEERWPRFDESLHALRSLLRREGSFDGAYYATGGIELEPRPVQQPGPPIWVASWGSRIGLRRVARLGDGWIASGYNTTPDQFDAGLTRLEDELRRTDADPAGFPNAIATMFFHLTEDEKAAGAVVSDRLAPTLDRPPEELADRLPVGSVERCVDLLEAYRAAGAQRVFLWPVEPDPAQLRRFGEEVAPRVADGG